MDFSEHELQLIQKGLDLLMRVHLGQVAAVLQPLEEHLFFNKSASYSWRMTGTAVRRHAEVFGELITGVPNGGPGIGNPDVAEEARDAYRLIAKLRGDKLGMTLFLKKENP